MWTCYYTDISFIREIKSIMDNIIRYFVSSYYNGYIVGYAYYNGYREVKVYIRKCYNNNYTFTLDYALAKTFTYKTAKKHMDNLYLNEYGKEVIAS